MPAARIGGLFSLFSYSTFSLYEPDAFEDALAAFRAAVERCFADSVEWYDENILIQAVRDDG